VQLGVNQKMPRVVSTSSVLTMLGFIQCN